MAVKETTTHAVLPQVVRGADLDRRAVLYARVSTLHQGQDPELQSREIREYCQRRGWPLVGEYVDAGISGAKERRPQLDRLIADAHKRKFEVIIVWKFDRFARSVSHLLRALENFRALGIEFVSLSEQIDTSTPTGKMIFTVLGAVAELERSLIAERVRAGLRNAKAKGRKLGRPAKHVNPAQIAALRAQGVPWRRIGAQLGVSPACALKAAQGRL
jgi:DNA invertase Pin-like site-specific DNA recombinase